MGHLDVSTLKGLSNIDETHNLCLNSKSFSDFKTEILKSRQSDCDAYETQEN